MEKTLRLTAEQRDDLVAYLDGELPDAQAQQIDQVLARSEVARHEVEALARTWEMLDVLPTLKAPPEFTERTMSTLKVAEVPFNLNEQSWFIYLKQAMLVAVWVLALSVSGWFGFQVTNAWIENPSQQMLTDLPTLQDFDLYQEVESFDFLDKLHKSKLFDEAADKPDVAGSATRSTAAITGATIRERHEQVARMSQVERDRLQRNVQAFQQAGPVKQAEYRHLTAQLLENKQTGGHLSSLLQIYSAWLHTLTPSQREELRLATDSGKKLILVQKFKEEQYRRVESIASALPEIEPTGPRPLGLPKPLNPSDVNAIIKILLTELPTDDQENLGKNPRLAQYPEILRRSIRHAESPREWPSASVQESMLAVVPTQVRHIVKRNPANQRERLIGLMFWSILSQANEEIRPRLPKDGDLKQIMESLDPDQRSRLEQRPPEEMRRELVRRYFDRQDDKSFMQAQDLRHELGRLMDEIGLPPPRGPMQGDGFPPHRPGENRPGRDGDRPPPREPPPPRDGRPPERRRDGPVRKFND